MSEIDPEFIDNASVVVGYIAGVEATINALEDNVVDGPVPIDDFIHALRVKIATDRERPPGEIAEELLREYAERQ